MSPQAFTADERERLQQTKSYLLNHLHENIRVKQLARRSGFGEQRFHEGFRLLFLYTPGRYLHEARMQTALVLLRHTDKTIKEIAGLCGFRHYKNFLTAFKKFFGETTGEALQRT